MTDKLLNQEKEENLIKNEEILFGRDWFLQTLVNMANSSHSIGFCGIPLLTHGFLVSGQLISGKDYFHGFAEVFSGGLSDADIETKENVKDSFIKMGNNVYEKLKDEDNPTPPAYIHLSEAKFFHPNGNPIPSNEGVFWRGRISEISGFSLGSLSIPNDKY